MAKKKEAPQKVLPKTPRQIAEAALGGKAKKTAAKAPAKKVAARKDKDAQVAPKPASPQNRKSARPPVVAPGTVSGVPDSRVLPASQQPAARLESGQFAPGASGNPGGRPKTRLMAELFRAGLAKPVPGDKEGRTYGEMLVHAAIREAAKGSIDHLKEINDRSDGKATQRTELTGKDGGPVDIASLTPEQRDAQLMELAAELGFVKGAV